MNDAPNTCEKHKGATNAAIARMLKRSPATIGRELKINKGLRGYHPNQANKKSQERRYRKSPEITEFGKAFIVHLIQQDWSPEQISKRLRKVGWEDEPSYEWIYLYIYDLKKQKVIDLTQHLRSQKPYRKRSLKAQARRGRMLNKPSIHERSAVINNRERTGDFEGDTIRTRPQRRCGNECMS